MVKKIVRLESEKKIAGVCAGIAKYLNIDVTLVRLFWVIATLFSIGTGLLAYIACWILIPSDEQP